MDKATEEKIARIIDFIVSHGCIDVDRHNNDYCRYCDRTYGNVNNIRGEVPHNENCVYTDALDLYFNSPFEQDK